MKSGKIIVLCMVLIAAVSRVSCDPLRQKRQSVQHYIIDTLVVVDDVMYSKFSAWLTARDENYVKREMDKKLREYVSLIVHQANDRLKTLQNQVPFYVTAQVVEIDIGQNILGNSGQPLLSETALNTFRDWINQKGYGNLYDHVILLTGHELSKSATDAGDVGRAYTGGICYQDGQSSSVVEAKGGFDNVYFVAHEIAHSLGSVHDGEELGATCSPLDYYIMTPSRGVGEQGKEDHPWRFSSCSARQIQQTISAVVSESNPTVPNCFLTTATPIAEFTSTQSAAPGQLYSADDQCRIIYGQASRACFDSQLPYGRLSDVCTSLYCLNPASSSNSNLCVRHLAAEGTTCGNRKWCRLGHCVASDDAPELTECPTGDSLTTINGLPCSEYISAEPSACYQDDIRNLCCSSCLKAKKTSSTCPYGDHVQGCTFQQCQFPAIAQGKCCGTCNIDVITESECTDVTSVDGVTCETTVQRGGVDSCKDPDVAKSCCKTCSQLANSGTGDPNSALRIQWSLAAAVILFLVWMCAV